MNNNNIDPEPPDIFTDWFNINISNNINIPNNHILPINKYNFNNRKIDNNIHFGNNQFNNQYTDSYKYNHSVINNFSFKDIPQFNYNNNIKDVSLKYKKGIDAIFNNSKLTLKQQNIKCKSHTTKYDKVVINFNKIIKTRQIQFFTTKIQKITLATWFNECTKVYNYCCDKFNNNPTFFRDPYTITKLAIFNELYGADDKSCPYAILTNEVKRFHSNIQSCYTNLRNKYITQFTMKHKNIIKSQSICIPYNSVKNGTFYSTFLGTKIKGLKTIIGNNVVNDCFIIHDKINKRYTMNMPCYENKNNNILQREPIVALDPGEKIFMAYHGLDSYGKIGIDVRKKILLYQKRIKKYQSVLKNGKNRKGKNIKKANKKKIKQHIQRNYNKIKNFVKELHNKTALFLCKNYERILIPEFKTQSMISNGKNSRDYKKEIEIKKKIRNYNINDAYNEDPEYGKSIKKYYNRKSRLATRVKFVLMSLSHYKFRQHLFNKSEEYGCKMELVTEEYTSMTCTNCGLQSKNYNNRIKSCRNCKYKIDRDIGGSRNILIKNINPQLKELNKKTNKSGIDASH